ncbi:MAG: hypothetical protein ACE5JM_07725 [Armatimonadota bacterium]
MRPKTSRWTVQRVMISVHRMLSSNLLMGAAGCVLILEAVTGIFLAHKKHLALEKIVIVGGSGKRPRDAVRDMAGSHIHCSAATEDALFLVTKEHDGVGVHALWEAPLGESASPRAWRMVRGPFQGAEIKALAVGQGRGGAIAVATSSDRVYLSRDNGASWQGLGRPGLRPHTKSLSFGLRGDLYAAGESALARWSFSGDGWTRLASLPRRPPGRGGGKLHLEALVKRIHKGEYLGRAAPLWPDFAGLCLLGFGVSGLYRWFKRSTRRGK